MQNKLKTWVKILLTGLAGLALLDMWRNWAWGKRLAAVFVNRNEDEDKV
jgi:hypothetical protein